MTHWCGSVSCFLSVLIVDCANLAAAVDAFRQERNLSTLQQSFDRLEDRFRYVEQHQRETREAFTVFTSKLSKMESELTKMESNVACVASLAESQSRLENRVRYTEQHQQETMKAISVVTDKLCKIENEVTGKLSKMESKVASVTSMVEQHQQETMKVITDKLTKMENVAERQACVTENQRRLQQDVANMTESQRCLQHDVANMTESQCRLQKQMATLQSQVSEVIRHQVHLSERKEQSKSFSLSPPSTLPLMSPRYRPGSALSSPVQLPTRSPVYRSPSCPPSMPLVRPELPVYQLPGSEHSLDDALSSLLSDLEDAPAGDGSLSAIQQYTAQQSQSVMEPSSAQQFSIAVPSRLHVPSLQTGEGFLPKSDTALSLAPSSLPSLHTPGEGSLPVSDTAKNLAPSELPSLQTPGEGCIQSVGDMTFGSSLSSVQAPRDECLPRALPKQSVASIKASKMPCKSADEVFQAYPDLCNHDNIGTLAGSREFFFRSMIYYTLQ